MIQPANAEKPDTNSFQYKLMQQFLTAYQPVPTACSNIILYLILTSCFLVGTILLLSISTDQFLTQIRYDNLPSCLTARQLNLAVDPSKPSLQTNKCEFTFQVSSQTKTVYLSYGLTNMFQNNRKYVLSVSNNQLLGIQQSDSTTRSSCSPFATNYQMGWYQFPHNQTAYPCGAIAKSFFNDTFQIYDSSNNKIAIVNNGISVVGDASLYKRDSTKNSRINLDSEQWRVWARLSASNSFKKPIGKIQGGLAQGTYKVVVTNRYPTNGVEGKKTITIAQTSLFGSKNFYLPVSYVVLLVMSFAGLITFTTIKVRGLLEDQYSLALK